MFSWSLYEKLRFLGYTYQPKVEDTKERPKISGKPKRPRVGYKPPDVEV